MYYGRRRGCFFPSMRKAYKKARWQKAYDRECNRVKLKILCAMLGIDTQRTR